jgi:hypothetical protein
VAWLCVLQEAAVLLVHLICVHTMPSEGAASAKYPQTAHTQQPTITHVHRMFVYNIASGYSRLCTRMVAQTASVARKRPGLLIIVRHRIGIHVGCSS